MTREPHFNNQIRNATRFPREMNFQLEFHTSMQPLWYQPLVNSAWSLELADYYVEWPWRAEINADAHTENLNAATLNALLTDYDNIFVADILNRRSMFVEAQIDIFHNNSWTVVSASQKSWPLSSNLFYFLCSISQLCGFCKQSWISFSCMFAVCYL